MEPVIRLRDEFEIHVLANLEGTGLYQTEKSLFWENDGHEIDLMDIHLLKACMENYRNKADYKKVKFINQILCQYDFAKKNDHVEHFPEMFQIEHTDICNSRCIMCNHFFTKNHGCSFLSMEAIHEIEKYLPYTKYIALNGIGEPFLHPQIMDIMEIYEKYGIQMTTNTNLSIMNPELASIINRTFSDIQISCDAADKETYEAIRKGLDFEKFKTNAEILRRAGNVEICMATVVMRQNILQLPQIVELAADLGCNKVVLLDLNTSKLLQNQDDTIKSFPHTAKLYMDKARETAERRGIILHTLDYINSFQNTIDEDIKEKEIENIVKKPLYPDESLAENLYQMYADLGFEAPCFSAIETDYCTPSRYDSSGYCQFIENRPFISAQGHVFNCCTRRMHSMGNLNTTEFAKIWNGDALCSMRNIFNRGKLPYYCTGCTYLRSNLMVERIHMGKVDEYFYSDLYDQLRMDIISKNLGDVKNEYI